MRYWRLDFNDGDFHLVRSPPLIKCSLIREYQSHLFNILEEIKVYPISEEFEQDLYKSLGIYYKKIATLVDRKIDCDRLQSSSRHKFFVCTEPVVHPKTEKVVTGLPGLSQIMGYHYHDIESEEPEHTTGDYELDLYVNTLLTFKASANRIVRQMCPEDIGKMLVQAGHLLSDATKDKKEKTLRAAIADDVSDHPRFIQIKDRVTKALTDLNIELPQGW